MFELIGQLRQKALQCCFGPQPFEHETAFKSFPWKCVCCNGKTALEETTSPSYALQDLHPQLLQNANVLLLCVSRLLGNVHEAKKIGYTASSTAAPH